LGWGQPTPNPEPYWSKEGWGGIDEG